MGGGMDAGLVCPGRWMGLAIPAVGGATGFGRWAGGMGLVRPGGGVADGFGASRNPGCAGATLG